MIKFLALVLLICFAVHVGSIAPSDPPRVELESEMDIIIRHLSVPLYRYYNAGIKDHFYTTNFNELGNGRNGFNYEGIQCKLIPSVIEGIAGSIPLYRYYNGHDHFYTTDEEEIGTSDHGVTGRHGYTSEGVTGHCFPVLISGTVPLYRYLHPTIGNHFYTTEQQAIGTTTPGQVGNYGYKSEGVACYVIPR